MRRLRFFDASFTTGVHNACSNPGGSEASLSIGVSHACGNDGSWLRGVSSSLGTEVSHQLALAGSHGLGGSKTRLA